MKTEHLPRLLLYNGIDGWWLARDEIRDRLSLPDLDWKFLVGPASYPWTTALSKIPYEKALVYTYSLPEGQYWETWTIIG